jgi:hypothetical protein
MSGEILCQNTIWHLTEEEKNYEVNQKERYLFDEIIVCHCGVTVKETELGPSLGVSVITPEYEVYDDDKTKEISLPKIDNIAWTSEHDTESYNVYITSEVLLPKGDKYKVEKVVQSKVDEDGKPKGLSNDNPILDTKEYEVEFADGDRICIPMLIMTATNMLSLIQ